MARGWYRSRRRRKSSYTPPPTTFNEYTPPPSNDAITVTPETALFRFPTWEAFATAAIEATSVMPDSQRSSKIDTLERNTFAEGTPAQAAEWAKLGWLEGAAIVKKYSDVLFDRISGLIEREEIRYDVEGAMFDVGRICERVPEAWMNFETVLVEGQPQHLRLVINIVCSGGISPKVILARGSVVCALIELLEFSGRRVELTMACSIGGYSNKNFHATAVVKKFDEPLDLPKVVYAFAHPTVLRRHIFALEESLSPEHRASLSVGSGYGQCMDVPSDERGDLYIPMMMYGETQWMNESSAIAWIEGELVRLGVPLTIAASGGN